MTKFQPEYQAVVLSNTSGLEVTRTEWKIQSIFAPMFMTIYERFPQNGFRVCILERVIETKQLTSATLYSILWQDEMGRHLDRIQKEITGDDEGISDEGIMDDAQC